MLTLKQADVGAREELVNDQQHLGLSAVSRIMCQNEIGMKTGLIDLGGKMSYTKVKTSFNYCSSGSGQNSVIPVVCDVPE